MSSQSQFNRLTPMKQTALTGGICRQRPLFKKIVPDQAGTIQIIGDDLFSGIKQIYLLISSFKFFSLLQVAIYIRLYNIPVIFVFYIDNERNVII